LDSSRPYFQERDRERERESGQLLIRIILFGKKYQKKLQQKKEIKQAKTKKGLCVYLLFVFAVALCD
jgi:hypothetical protein